MTRSAVRTLSPRFSTFMPTVLWSGLNTWTTPQFCNCYVAGSLQLAGSKPHYQTILRRLSRSSLDSKMKDLSKSESQKIQYSKRSRLTEAVTEAAVIHLGVVKTFRFLNPLGQKPAMLATSLPDAPKWALALASYMGEVPIVKALLSRNAKLRTTKAVNTALPLAAGRGHLEMVQLLLDGGADVNYQKPIWSPLIQRLPRHCRPIHYGTALEAACASLLEPVITLLLQSPQNVAGSSRGFHNAVRIIVCRHDSDAETLQNLVFLLLGAVKVLGPAG